MWPLRPEAKFSALLGVDILLGLTCSHHPRLQRRSSRFTPSCIGKIGVVDGPLQPAEKGGKRGPAQSAQLIADSANALNDKEDHGTKLAVRPDEGWRYEA